MLVNPKQQKIIIFCLVLVLSLSLAFSAYAVKLENPLGNVTGYELFARVIKAVLGFVGALALLNLIIAGIKLLTSQGKPEGVKSARDNIIWTVVAIVLIFSSYSILAFVMNKLMGK